MKIVIMHENVFVHDAINNDIERMFEYLSKEYETVVFAVNHNNERVKYISQEELESLLAQKETVVIYHVSTLWERGFELIKNASARIIFRYHNITPANYFRGIDNEAYNSCKRGAVQVKEYQKSFPDAVWICDSYFNAKDIYYIPDEHIGICPPFNNVDQWASKAPDEGIKSELEGFDGLNLLFVGRVVPNKGYVFLLNIMRQLKASYPKLKFKVRIIGKLDVIPQYASLLRSIIKKGGLDENIEFIGELTDEKLISYYRYSDIFLACTQHEGFCVPIVEAQYFSLPIIALRYAAVPETIGEEQLLLAPEVTDFAAAIHTLAENKEYREYLGKKGRENYEKRFTKEKIEKAFAQELKMALSADSAFTVKKELPIAFVMPWFGEKVPGGAEMEARGCITDLHRKGVNVEMLTTCVKEFTANWNEDYYPEGTEIMNGIPIRHFKVRKRNEDRFNSVNIKFMNNDPVTSLEEKYFLEENVNSYDLYDYMDENKDAYRFFVFIPYMFGTTYYGVRHCGKKSIMIPCLHDESYAYISYFKDTYKNVAGMLYNAYPEKDLANRLYDLSQVKQEVIGVGIDTDVSGDAARFREKYKLDSQFILYAGRKSIEKGVDKLIEYFIKYKEKNRDDLKLILIGAGDIEFKYKKSEDIIDLGFVSRQDKYDACAAALCLCQLSHNESFSIVIMESWLCGRPVMVSSECPVTKDFCERFEGGFAVGNEEEFSACIRKYMEAPEQAKRMAESGRAHVKENFDRDIIANKILRFMDELEENK